jgi:hypothetical protein
MAMLSVSVSVGCGFRGEDVDFGACNAAADDFAGFEACADVEGGCGLFEKGNGDAGVDKCAEEHVATDAGEAVEIADTHRLLILIGGILALKSEVDVRSWN